MFYLNGFIRALAHGNTTRHPTQRRVYMCSVAMYRSLRLLSLLSYKSSSYHMKFHSNSPFHLTLQHVCVCANDAQSNLITPILERHGMPCRTIYIYVYAPYRTFNCTYDSGCVICLNAINVMIITC